MVPRSVNVTGKRDNAGHEKTTVNKLVFIICIANGLKSCYKETNTALDNLDGMKTFYSDVVLCMVGLLIYFSGRFNTYTNTSTTTRNVLH